MQLNQQQRESLYRVYLMQHTEEQREELSYLAFRRSVEPTFDGCAMVFCEPARIYIGIETDGYAHS